MDYAIDLGDRVNAVDAETDGFWQGKLIERFNRLAMPLGSVDGNHDVRHLPRNPSAVVTVKGYTIVFLES